MSSKAECHPLEHRSIYMTRPLCLGQPSVSTWWISLNRYAVVKLQMTWSKGISVSQLTNYKILNYLSPFRQSSEMYFQCSVWPLFL